MAHGRIVGDRGAPGHSDQSREDGEIDGYQAARVRFEPTRAREHPGRGPSHRRKRRRLPGPCRSEQAPRLGSHRPTRTADFRSSDPLLGPLELGYLAFRLEVSLAESEDGGFPFVRPFAGSRLEGGQTCATKSFAFRH